jgi:DNA-binding transcriptional ArsR family regulator
MLKTPDYKKQAQVLKALAHPSRLMIVDRLQQGPCTAGDLTRLVGSDQSTVSKHLSLLKAKGIVDDRREGNSVVYELMIPCVRDFFTCACKVIDHR